MTVITSKVCVVGDFAVGKTSVVERYVNNQFSDKYLTTVGVKVDTCEVPRPDTGITHKLVIWDVAGADRFGDTEFAYLRGAGGYIFVADGTRGVTLRAVRDLKQQIVSRYGPAPDVLLVNKKDLTLQWEISDRRLEELAADFGQVFTTSAKTGDDVRSAIDSLSRRILDRDLERQ